MSIAERKRAQACQDYYQPWLASHGSEGAVAEALEQLNRATYTHADQLQQLATRDPTLIAIAQNVVLRLSLRRCMVSLIDDKHQYVIAEATRSCSSLHPNGLDGDDIWLGQAILSRPDAMCEHCLDSRCQTRGENGTIHEHDGMIINDCRQDPQFAQRPYVMQEEGTRVRFYAGVPLTTHDGYKIGILAVTDERPLDNGLTTDQFRCLQDMAACAMTQLEWARSRVDRYKGERIVQGLATLVDRFQEDAGARRVSKQSNVNSGDSRTSDGTHQAAHEQDDLQLMYTNAADLLRSCTLADGCLILGALVDSSKPETDNAGTTTPQDYRPCRMLARSLPENVSDCMERSVMTVDALLNLSRRFARGQLFSPSQDEGEEDKDNELQAHTRLIARLLPGAETVLFLPLTNQLERRPIAGIFAWSSTAGRTALRSGLPHLRAFAICMEREVVRINMERDEAAKTTFIASMSHELRSPLHGILGAAEFLLDCTNTTYESGLVTSITLCGKQLLETLNHVLHHSKINSLQASHTRGQADDGMEAVDLGALVEEASEAITIGHTFKTVSDSVLTSPTALSKSSDQPFASLTSQDSIERDRDRARSVIILLDIKPRQNWMVKVDPGSIQRVVMNLLGNALKFTSCGFVAVSLRATGEPDEHGKLDVLLRIVDSGKGMGEAFQREAMFRPFSQENSFAAGTGLGLSIVKQIVNDLDGSIQVNSRKDVGTEIDVRFRLPTVPQDSSETRSLLEENTFTLHANLLMVNELTRGKHLVLLDPLDPEQHRSPLEPASRFQQNLKETCEQWFDMRVTRARAMKEHPDNTDIYLYGEPPAIEMLRMHKAVRSDQPIPVILACQNDRDAISVIKEHRAFLQELGSIVEVMQQPCGPRKLAMVLYQCFKQAEAASPAPAAHRQRDVLAQHSTPNISVSQLSKSVSATVALPVATPIIELATPGLNRAQSNDRTYNFYEVSNPTTATTEDKPQRKGIHALIVDDNKINRRLLMTFFEKADYSYEEAENGQEAVDMATGPADSGSPAYDVIMMDISMPIMDGLEATRQIRAWEQDHDVKRTKIVALTGLASAKAREDAEAAGVDIFMAKPVRFAELKKLLQSWQE